MKQKIIFLFFSFINVYYVSAQADAGPDKAICSSGGSGVVIGNMSENSNFCYSWKSSPTDPNVANLKTAKITVNPTQTTTYTLTVVGQDFSTLSTDEVKVFVVNDVVFSEAANQKYGYDDHTNPSIPWKSVEVGQSDPIKVKITPASGYEGVYFKVNSFSFFQDVTVAPTKASSDQFDLTITGTDDGEDEVNANCEKEDGDKIKEFNVKSMEKITKTVAIRLVHDSGFNSTDGNDAAILDYLNNKVYNQSVVEWTVVRLPAKTIKLDINNNGVFDVDGSGAFTAEMQRVIDLCKDDSYDHNIFFVDKPSPSIFGVAPFNQRYGWVHGDNSPHMPTTTAHELGHCGFGLQHSSGGGVANNIMTQGAQNKFKLWKNQWDIINP